MTNEEETVVNFDDLTPEEQEALVESIMVAFLEQSPTLMAVRVLAGGLVRWSDIRHTHLSSGGDIHLYPLDKVFPENA